MNTPETKDKLKNMFHEIKMEDTSTDFMKNLMLRVEKEAVTQKKRKYFLNYALIAVGILGIFIIPASIIYFLDITITPIKFPNILLELQGIFENFNIDPKIIGLGVTILLLLLGDSILRKFSDHKRRLRY